MKYKLFGTQTGLPASEIILGAANFGQHSGYGAEAGEIQKILATYTDAGGNFIDISDQYQFGEAEKTVGQFIEHQRHNFILCTKYTRSNEKSPLPANFGNHRKAMRQSVDSSLKRLKTDYIDIYMPHYDDGNTPLDEIIRGLEDLVSAGKILYTGLANFPAWKAAAIASVIPLTALQIEYNLVQRSADRELLAMAEHFGLGTMLYSPLAGGLLTGKYRKGATGRLTIIKPGGIAENETTGNILDQLEAIALEIDASLGQVALAWTLTKNAFPIVGARTVDQLTESLKALDMRLNEDQVARLETASLITLGYPNDLLKSVQKSY